MSTTDIGNIDILDYDNLDVEPAETAEWLEAIAAVLKYAGPLRGQYLLEQLIAEVSRLGGRLPRVMTPYVNTIPVAEEASIPQDDGIASRLRNIIRWNAAAMVIHTGKYAAELGGHISSYASSATLYEVGFNHFYHAETTEHGGDLVFFQGHSSPGIYARSFLEGSLSLEQLTYFRREVDQTGLSSYPHPWLMPSYWQFPTVSMGLGPFQAIYQARFMKYLHNRGLIDAGQRKVWCYIGDGETDEPETKGAITLAAREGLDNLIFVINCNLQRLDGPVRGNGKIIQELEAVFRGAGWHVLKVIWGRGWDALLAKDKTGLLIKRMNEAVDGDYQAYKAHDGAFVREHFFGKYPELLALVKDMTDDEIWRLNRGGHDAQKVFAAYTNAVRHKGQPVVILAKTVKGFGMGEAGEGQNTTHQQKKMNAEQLKAYRDRFNLPLTDKQAEEAEFILPDDNSAEIKFLKSRRAALGGAFPARRPYADETLAVPDLTAFAALTKGSGEREISTTMAFVRLLNVLLKDKTIGERIVPIVPDESRTFGMEGLFRQIGIYSAQGQLYRPVDADQVMYYREASDGQILQEGLNEGAGFCSWMAAGTAYSHHNKIMIPFYVYYSMFGFQRIGDFAWAAGDMQTRGFLLGGTAGRTTLAGEGLQHQDGHSHVMADMIPNCISYDPCYSYELAVIIQDGLRRMVTEQENVFYYLTVMNENYTHPAMPEGITDGIIKGMYLLRDVRDGKKAQIQLLGSGTILREVEKAADLLAEHFEVSAVVWSVTSFTELARDGMDKERANRFRTSEQLDTAYVTRCLNERDVPVLAATDYIRSYADKIRPYVHNTYVSLGTDGFGRSDTRARLRHFFEVDANHIAFSAIRTLVDAGTLPPSCIAKAMTQFAIDPNKANPTKV